MFAYPKKTEFNRPVPKTKIYAHAKATKRIKELFVAQVDEIIWKYKLSPETLNLPGRNGFNEIQVFEVVLKVPEVDTKVLQAIDKAVAFPLMFQLIYEGQIHFATSYKRRSEADAFKWVVEASFKTEPQPVTTVCPPLPVALDIVGLYEQMVRSHIPLPPRTGETLADHVVRYQTIAAKQTEHHQLENQLAQEKQFNRKVELNASLRFVTKELQNLQRP